MNVLGDRRARLRVLWILLAASFVMALPALQGEVLSYDDAALLQGPDGALERGPASFFTDTYYYAWLPFYGLSYRLDGLLFGVDPAQPDGLPFHLGNVLWHAAACYAAWAVLAILLRHRTAALIGALLFAVHPLHVESVAWIAGRKELVSGFFLFAAWLMHLRAERGSAWWRAGGVVLFLLATFAKASAVVLPGLLVAAALMLPRYRGRRRGAVLATLPFVVAALVPVAVHLAVGVSTGVVRDTDPLGIRVLSGLAAWGDAIRRTVLPVDLALDYPGARVTAIAGAWPAVFLVAAVAALVAWRRRAPAVAFGIAAFLVALLPFNDVFPSTDVYAADRYLYLPLVGFAFVAGWVAREWRHGAFAGAVVACALVVLSFLSSMRFVDDETLWTRTIEARDASTVAWFNRGAARVVRAREKTPPDEALLRDGIHDLRAALARARLVEHRLKANGALVEPLLKLGEIEEALERVADALQLVEGIDNPEARRYRADLLYSRGGIHVALRRWAQAARDYSAAAALAPAADRCLQAGLALLRTGSLPEARRMLERAADYDRTDPAPLLALARLEQALNDRAAQRRMLSAAADRAPDDERVLAARVSYWLEGRTPNYRQAAAVLEKLPLGSPIRRRLEAEVEAERALYHFRRGDLEGAITAADLSREFGLARSRSLFELGHVYLEAGRYDDAVTCFRDASDAMRQQAATRDAIARAYFLKGYARLKAGDEEAARRAVAAALEVRPQVVEAGAAPLRGELALLGRTRHPLLPLLAVAAVAGDPAVGTRVADRLFGGELDDAQRRLAWRLRALLRGWATYDFDGAEEDLHAVLAAVPGDRWALLRLAQVRLAAGLGWMRTADEIRSVERRQQGRRLVESSIELLDELIARAPDFLPARLQRGQARFVLEDHVGAKADYQYVAQRDPDAKEVLLREAALNRLVYVRGGDPSNLTASIRLLQRALDVDPNYFEALYELGNVYHLLYDDPSGGAQDRRTAFNQAIIWYRRAMALNPRAPEPRLEWARICLKATREALAAQEIATADALLERIEAGADDVAAVHEERVRLNMHPEFLQETGTDPDARFERAHAALERLEELAPSSPVLPELRALLHRTRGYSYYWTWAKAHAAGREARAKRARELAVESWKRALAAWPDDPENASVRDRLREIAPEMVELDVVRAREAFERGGEAMQAREWKEAAGHFREALALFPEAAHIRMAYAQALARGGRLDDAHRQFERVANGPEGPRFPGAFFELGKIAMVRRETLVARAWLERYLEAMEAADRTDDPMVARARTWLEELAGNERGDR